LKILDDEQRRPVVGGLDEPYAELAEQSQFL